MRRNPRASPCNLGCLPYLLFAIYIRLIWVSLFTVPNTILNYVMQQFQIISDKIVKTFKEGLMHPGLAMVVELGGFLGDFPSLGSYFL